MKKIGVAVLTVSLALTAACSNNEEAASEDKETKQTEETTKNTNTTKKTEPEKEPQEQGEKESESDEYTLDSDNLEDYRAKDNSLIWVFKSSLEVAGSSLKRMDYSLNGHVDEEDAKVKTLMLKDTTATEAIPALKEISYYDVPNMNITRENEDCQ